MNRYLKTVKVNNLYHLKDFSISIDEDNSPHLIITGKNGSGKTVLLKAIAEFLQEVKQNKSLSFLNIDKSIDFYTRQLKDNINQNEIYRNKQNLDYNQKRKEGIFGRVELELQDIYSISEQIQKGEFICSFYSADRKADMVEPKAPAKLDFSKELRVTETRTREFLNFLVDLKVQEALARNENQLEDANLIRDWFVNFEGLLKNLYKDSKLMLQFNYKDYSFLIKTDGKSFKFTQMSDGYIAAIDIIADLILKMQRGKSLTYSFQKQGIVLIDEIETHLHLELQRVILPLLAGLFPNIQFIITTHSPFVLSSLPTAVAYDLEKRESISDLTEYSYESLAEGYFGVITSSSYSEMRLLRFKDLLGKGSCSDLEIEELKSLLVEFEKIPEMVSPLIIGEYKRLKIQFSDFIKTLK